LGAARRPASFRDLQSIHGLQAELPAKWLKREKSSAMMRDVGKVHQLSRVIIGNTQFM